MYYWSSATIASPISAVEAGVTPAARSLAERRSPDLNTTHARGTEEMINPVYSIQMPSLWLRGERIHRPQPGPEYGVDGGLHPLRLGLHAEGVPAPHQAAA